MLCYAITHPTEPTQSANVSGVHTASPVYFRRNLSRQVLYYEVVHRWLLPSLRTCCHRKITSFLTLHGLKALRRPSRAVSLSTSTALSCRRRTNSTDKHRCIVQSTHLHPHGSFGVRQKLVDFDIPAFERCSTLRCH